MNLCLSAIVIMPEDNRFEHKDITSKILNAVFGTKPQITQIATDFRNTISVI